ncbi:MAG: hypothetical protein DKM50_01505 [Candidatus Margulisiibacteriota bacterium]|nr:MAG: hypothetical protein A2X43_08305 [Candidatus Margulisbacteria bacterium GWD2_39_127]OGI03122.1 MAG: hypothetical protein A2X42_10865 [Candidatus Margulisbacteria bacterium GWF2_38_17]OGI11675.1 MAG: hypothetical protein A2X41_10325 [Candidatus Margulisbacteria bacterium GWE2_39_32]PZM83779.1 MAG: hypothetical protein DKM50_01505 [Candidatus Margulisiibacteriota bacterium]HAR63029.1 hypothetical protein [Candidatus Margulisiibacteriota bacterium]
MKHEIVQFYSAAKAKITADDEMFIRKHLSHQEQIIFYRQRIADQRHALDTAYKTEKEIEHSDWVNEKRILKTALLHDIGKAAVFMPLWVRPLVVISKKFMPSFLGYLAEKGSKPEARLAYRYFYTYVFHPEIGAKMLKEIGVEREVLTLISLHHEPPSPSEPKELPILRRADNAS